MRQRKLERLYQLDASSATVKAAIRQRTLTLTETVGAGVGRHFALFLSDAEKERRRFDDVVELGITVEVYRRGCGSERFQGCSFWLQ